MVVSWVAGGGNVGFGPTVFRETCTRCEDGKYEQDFVDTGVPIPPGPARVFPDEERVLVFCPSRFPSLSVGHLDLQCPVTRQ